MKIAFVVERFDPSLGGVEVYARGLARALVARGQDVHVFTSDPGPADSSLTIHPIRRTILKPCRHYTFAHRAACAVPRHEFDVVHGFGRTVNVDFAQLHGGVHRVWMDQQLAAAESPAQRTALLTRHKLGLNHMLNLGLEAEQFADPDIQIMAISQMTANQAMSIYGVAPDRVRVIYNGADIERFHPRCREQHRAEMRRRLGLRDELTLIFVGHNFVRKGLRNAIRALELLKDARPAVRLVVVGSDAPGRFAQEARSLGVGDKVHFAGRTREIEKYYAAADVFIFPTWYDPCALVTLEALASGLPVITSTFNGAGEVITPGREGYVVAPDDVAGLARSVRALLDADVRAAASRAARLAAEQHSTIHHVDEMMQYYESVVARKSAVKRPVATVPNVGAHRLGRIHGARDTAIAAIRAHNASLAGGAGQVVKDSPHSRLTIISVREYPRPLVVKEFRWRSLGHRMKDLLRPSQASREWRNGHRLPQLGIEVARPVAHVEPAALFRASSSYLITEALAGARRIDLTAYQALRDGNAPPRWKEQLLAQFAAYLSDLHERGIGHGDMKPSNILVRETDGRWEFFLIDLVNVRFTLPVSRAHSVLNLAQLNASMPLVITRTDRRRFLAAYLRGRKGLPPLRRVWEQVLRRTLKRHCIWQRDRPVE